MECVELKKSAASHTPDWGRGVDSLDAMKWIPFNSNNSFQFHSTPFHLFLFLFQVFLILIWYGDSKIMFCWVFDCPKGLSLFSLPYVYFRIFPWLIKILLCRFYICSGTWANQQKGSYCCWKVEEAIPVGSSRYITVSTRFELNTPESRRWWPIYALRWLMSF